MEVTILSKKMVKPASPTPQNHRNLPISSLDQLSNSSYVPVILYYAAADGGGDAAEGASQRKKQLEESLARVLSPYYPIAGRYISDKHMIDCNDEGAELTEAKVNCKLSQLMSGSFPVHKLNLLVSYGFESPTSPLMTIQLNEFDCGGIAIGVTFAHRIIDGISMSKFIRGWSAACRQEINRVQHCPSFQLASLLPARDGLPVVHSATRKKQSVKTVTRRFLFDEKAIRTLRDLASSENGGECRSLGGRFSRVQVVTALIWMVLIRASQAKNKGGVRSFLLTQPVNMRDKVKISIPQNSFGNFVILSNAKFVPANRESNVNFVEMVHFLRDAITSTVNQCAEFVGGDDLVAGVENKLKEGMCIDEEVDICRFSSWCNMSFYEAEFGQGKPIWVSSVEVPRDKLILLMDSKDGNGVEAWVSLNEKDMPFFQKDPEIVAGTKGNQKHRDSTSTSWQPNWLPHSPT